MTMEATKQVRPGTIEVRERAFDGAKIVYRYAGNLPTAMQWEIILIKARQP